MTAIEPLASTHASSDVVTGANDTPEGCVMAVYESHLEAEKGIHMLHGGGIDMRRLSIVGRDFRTEEQAVGFYTAGDRMLFWGGQGALWGGLWGMLCGGGLFFIPVLGHVLVLGPMVGWILGALEGAAVGGAAGAFGAALASVGVPDESVIRYETHLQDGRFLVMVRGPASMLERARRLLTASGASMVVAHHVT